MLKKILVNLIFPVLLLINYNTLNAQIILPKLISDGIVLQRDTPLPIWGWSSPKEKITLGFQNKIYKTEADSEGNWEIYLPAMTYGGPYQMVFSGKNTVTVNDVLIGDIWLATGQSNMVHQLNIHDVRYEKEIAEANYPEIRHFKIPTTTSISGPKKDLAGGEWIKAVGDEVRPFSAVAYFFAKKIYDKFHIPIGIINASVGGMPIQAWIPEEGFKNYPEILKVISENKDSSFVALQKKYYPEQKRPPIELKDKGLIGNIPWYDPKYKPKNWRRINIPGYWEDQGANGLNGVVWYRKEIDIPASMVGKRARLYMGRIVDADEIYINGVKIGNTTYQYPQRRYYVPKEVLKAGKNTFTVRVTNFNAKGGFVPDKPYYIFADKDTVDLKGYWQYKVGEVFKPNFNRMKRREKPKVRKINPQSEPSSLYNAMIAPYTQFPVKGILWYQGESNVGHPETYEGYLKTLAASWRKVFHEPKAPFIYAQLHNFMDISYLPSESNWAALREQQRKALADIPNSAMTVSIDVGEWNDVHPDNKKAVGDRMALAALKLAYGQNIVFSGPLFENYELEGHKIILHFSHLGSGLKSCDDEPLSEFAIAGDDGVFVWANAKIEGDTVIVWNDAIEHPTKLRYAWANNPDDPNLCNKENLPASPFELKIKKFN